jgi:DNA-binding NarL/FixJ family response regulator
MALGPAGFDAAWEAGRALSTTDAIAEARAVLAKVLYARPPIDLDGRAPVSGLSPRELEVLRLIARGHSNQQIANDLFISLTTVKAHVRSILTKLDLTSRTAAAAYAINSGLA